MRKVQKESTKKIKGSHRGLTFSFQGNEKFCPGRKYRYLVDVKNHMIVIMPSEDGGNTISRKRVGEKIKSLIDIRSNEVRKIVSSAGNLEISIQEDRILVKAAGETVIEVSEEILPKLAAGAEELVMHTVASVLESRHAGTGENIHLKSDEEEIRDGVSKAIRVISLFAGAGMLDSSFLESSRFQIVYAAEYDPDAVRTYRQNIGNEIHEVDIRELSADMLPGADILIGGPPCQPISAANRHDSSRFEHHPEGDMFAHYIRLVRECKIRAFLIENVPGLLSAKDGWYLKVLRESLPEYIIHSQVVKDCDLGGYTTRKRALIFGSREGDFTIPELKLFPPRTVRDALKKVDDTWANAGDVTKSNAMVQKKIAMVPEGGNWKDLPEEYWTKSVHSNMYRRLDRNKPSVAIANWRKYLLSPPRWDNSGKWDRILSVSEAAALQGLDRSFVFTGSLSAKQQQVANGVTKAIGRFARNVLESICSCSTKPAFV